MFNFNQNNGRPAATGTLKHPIWILLTASLVWALFQYIHVFQQIERLTLDERFRSRPPITESPMIGAIDVDEKSIHRVGSWPMVRTVYADILKVLERSDAEVLSFDIFFPDKGPLDVSSEELVEISTMITEGEQASASRSLSMLTRHPDDVLAKTLAETDLGVMGMTLGVMPPETPGALISKRRDTFLERQDTSGLSAVTSAEKHGLPLPADAPSWLPDAASIVAPLSPFSEASRGMGMAQIILDLDGTVRQYPTAATFNHHLYFSSALVTYCKLIQADLDQITLHENFVELPEGRFSNGTKAEALRLPVDKQGRLLVNWAGKYHDTFTHIPAHALLSLQAEALAKERIHTYANKLTELNDIKISDIKNDLVQRRLLPRDEAEVLVDNLLIAEFAEQAKALGIKDRNTFAEAFGGDDPATVTAAGDIYDQVAWCHAIMALMENQSPSRVRGGYPVIKKLLKIPDDSDAAMAHSYSYLTFIAFHKKDPEDWKPLYFPTRQLIKHKHGDEVLSPASLYGKAFYIGLTAVASHDMKPMPFDGQYPMVGLHQNVLNSLVTRAVITHCPPFAGWLITVVLAFIPAFLIRRLLPIASGMCTAAIGVLWTSATFVLFNNTGILFPIVAPLLSLAIIYLLLVVRKFLQEQTAKKLMHQAFSTYMTPAVVEEVLKTPDMLKLGGQDKDLTVFFADLENFTTFSENCDAQELVHIINEYLDGMTEIIFRHGGTLDKFEGDGIMAFWGAPVSQDDHARRACLAALDGQAWIKETLHPKWVADGRPAISARIGINSGTMVVGNMGSTSRMDYTVMGDNVNLAARMESANKFFGTHIMISSDTFKRVEDVVACRELDFLRVKGRQQPVVVYELINRHSDLTETQANVLSLFSKALNLYRAQEWETGKKAFEAVLAICPDDEPSKVYIRRCESYIQEPPGHDWDGVWVATEK